MFKRFILSKSTKINLIKLNNNVNNTLFKKHIATVAASSSSNTNGNKGRGSGKNGSWTDLMMFDDDSFDVTDVFADD